RGGGSRGRRRGRRSRFSWHFHVIRIRLLPVLAAQAYDAVALDYSHAAAMLRSCHAYRLLHRAPFAREIGDGDAARAALVHAPDAVARLGDREERRLHQPPFTRSSFFTWVTPRTRRATSAARFLVSCESTTPLSVTMPLSLSTLMRRSVFSPTSFMSAVCTLAVSAASTAKRVFF